MIEIKEIEFNLNKVKGHSGCQWNDTADLIAKTEGFLARFNVDRIINIKNLGYNIGSFIFLLVWNNIEIDRNVRKFTIMVSDALEEV